MAQTKRSGWAVAMAWALAGLAAAAGAHTRWAYPPPRPGEDIKVKPCGGVPPGKPDTAWTAGDSVRVSWDEFVDHPGWFEIFVSRAGDSAFRRIDSIPDTLKGGLHRHTLRVPGDTCSRCTFQIVQFMTNTKPITFYYSCADVAVVPKTPTPVRRAGARRPGRENPRPGERDAAGRRAEARPDMPSFTPPRLPRLTSP